MGQVRDYEALIRDLLAGVADGWNYEDLKSWLTSQSLQEQDLAQWFRESGEILWSEDESRQLLIILAGFGQGELAKSVSEVSQQWQPALVEWEEWLKKGVEYYYSDLHIESIPYFEKILAVKPQNPGILLKLGYVFSNSGRHKEALDILDRAIKVKPDLYKALYVQGLSLFSIGKHEEAIASFSRAIEFKPDFAEAWYAKGYTLASLQRYQEAVDSYDRAIEIKPDCVENWCERGVALTNLQRYEEAIDSYDRAIQLQPKYSNSWNYKGVVFERMKKYDEAIECYDRSIQLQPKCAEAFYNRGVTLSYLERYEEALTNFQDAIKINADYDQAWYNAGVMLIELKLHKKAFDCFKRSTEINPIFAEAWDNLGNTWAHFGEYEEALVCYKRVLQINPDDYIASDNLGLTLSKLGRYEEALSSCQHAINLDYDYDNAWDNMGVYLTRLGQDKEALICFKRAVEINPNFDQAWSNLGSVLVDLEEYEEAIASCDRSISINPEYFQAWNNRGVALAKLRLYKEAIESYEFAIKIEPKDYVAYHHKSISILNLYDYQAQIDTYYEAFKHINAETNSEGFGYLQHQIGCAHYQEAKNQLFNPDLKWQLYDRSLSSYKEALKTLTREQFPKLRLETLIDTAKVYLAQNNTSAASECQTEALSIWLELINAQPHPKGKKRLYLQYSYLLRTQVDLSILDGDPRLALAIAEFDKNKNLEWFLCAQAQQGRAASLILAEIEQLRLNVIGLQYPQMSQLLSPQQAIVYWHTSSDTLTTFILHPDKPEPEFLTSSSQPLQTWLKTYDSNNLKTEELQGKLEILKKSDNHNKPKLQTEIRDILETSDNLDLQVFGKIDKAKFQEALTNILKISDNLNNDNWKTQLTNILQTREFNRTTKLLKELANIFQISEINRHLNGIQHLILIPHRDLHRLPLHIYWTQLTTTYLPSIQIGLNLQAKPQPNPASSFLLVDSPNYQAATTTKKSKDLGLLPSVEIEVAVITALFAPKTTLKRGEITTAKLQAKFQQPHYYGHFNGHAYHDPRQPQNSSLILEDDDELTCTDLSAIDLNPYHLITLSACQTGVTTHQTIDTEYVGIVSAFLSRGTNYVVSTLWSVQDLPSSLLMMAFYLYIKQGIPAPAALRQAANWLRNLTYAKEAEFHRNIAKLVPPDRSTLLESIEDNITAANNQNPAAKPYSSPKYWAAFTISGWG
jgi:tetratricopeptide (TPR) repeat protein/CHAT domain-containing protein